MVSAKNGSVFVLIALALPMVSAKLKLCAPSSCGNLSITHPFRVRTDPAYCGERRFELVCENNRTTLVTKLGKFFVENISVNDTFRLVDASLDMNKCSIPNSLIDNRLSLSNTTMYVFKCNRPVNSSLYVDASACANSVSSLYTYFFLFNSQARSLILLSRVWFKLSFHFPYPISQTSLFMIFTVSF